MNSVISTEQLVCRCSDIIVIAGNRVISQSDLGKQLRPSASVDPSSLGEYTENRFLVKASSADALCARHAIFVSHLGRKIAGQKATRKVA